MNSTEIARLQTENYQYKMALENIIKHQEIVAGKTMARLSVAWRIATRAIEDAKQG